MHVRGRVDRHVPPRLIAVVAGAAIVAGGMIAVGPAAARGRAVPPRSNGSLYNFKTPTSAAVSGGDLFVTNGAGNSVTEVSASSGAYVATISANRFKFADPTAIAAVGADLFVTNGTGDSVTEFSKSSREHIRTIRRSKDHFADPVALAPFGTDLFVLNGTGSITEIADRTGALVGTVSGVAFGFHHPTDVALAGSYLFVTNPSTNSVTVVNARTRALVVVLTGGSYQFDAPTGVAFDGSNVWVTNQNSESVTEISGTTLQELNWVQSGNLPMVAPITYGDGYIFTVSPPGSSPMVSQVVPSSGDVTWMMCNTNGPYLFDNPEAAVVSGENLWIVNEGGNSLTEMDTDSGALIRTVS